LVDASDLFQNVTDLKEIDHIFDYMSPEQKEVLTQFWGNIQKLSKKTLHEEFFSIWHKLYSVYRDFKELLQSKNKAYPGMISREVAENFRKNEINIDYAEIYIVGLNVLNSCEKVIFNSIR